MEEILGKLGEFKGIGVYFSYLKSAVKAAEIYMTQLRKVEELTAFKEALLVSCERLLDSDVLSYSLDEPEINSFMEYLRVSLL